jgi:hypothetical protein
MRIEGGMVDLRQRDAVEDYGLPQPLVLVGIDMGGVQKQRPGKGPTTRSGHFRR